MKKFILSSLIVTMLFFGGTANAGIIIGGAVGATIGAGAGTAILPVAFVLSLFVAPWTIVTLQKKADPGFERIVATLVGVGAGVGVIFLDEDRQMVEFGSIDPSNASKYDLTEDEVVAYNEGLPGINLALDELSKRYNDETTMTKEEATAAYNEVAKYADISPGARSALSKVLAYYDALTENNLNK